MQQKKDVTSNISQGLGSIFERISNFFHIFDLPFFVSGSVILGSMFFGGMQAFEIGIDSSPLPNWLTIFFTLITTYVLGLMSFTIGRKLNESLRSKILKEKFEKAIEHHHLNEIPTVKKYSLDNEDGENWYLYTRMWQDLVAHRSGSKIFKHLSRYWALTALYDSLAFAFVIWGLVLLILIISKTFITPLSVTISLLGAISFFILSHFAFKQAIIYYEYQIEDLVASSAASKEQIF